MSQPNKIFSIFLHTVQIKFELKLQSLKPKLLGQKSIWISILPFFFYCFSSFMRSLSRFVSRLLPTLKPSTLFQNSFFSLNNHLSKPNPTFINLTHPWNLRNNGKNGRMFSISSKFLWTKYCVLTQCVIVFPLY